VGSQPPRQPAARAVPVPPRAAAGLGIACCPLQPEDYAASWERQRRTQPTSASSGPLPATLPAVLGDPTCLAYYEKFLRRQRQHPRLAFVLEAREFAAMAEDADGTEDADAMAAHRREAAAAIYAQYLAPQGPASLGLAPEAARALQERVFDDETELPVDVFAPLAAETYAQLEQE
jgi:hypothetical protein